ncbi:MAG: hypothetical protein COX81_01960 [Candidatus Magasanikbacteria bacterium CG_4_10_14_0_2_um_filter_37_12]|uniref:PEP-utilising enzyme C-terminal domain-containing protein n=1 Tax=Candidatus Magasanikbacteria bacterium CG_4_10_14_0_2_um_filter_37_12 TaxID=1974637 RepID=A0A2M7V8D5_9BACT|nr:MAG: hypothetical protein COX81_01960 [Candidatus Magasanikbacteria bacterium CG_4_10_14_0_2_um_filter_37_12]
MKQILLKGDGVSPGIISGKLKYVKNIDSASKIVDGDIVFAKSLHPPLPSQARHASAFIIQSASEADHTVSYIKEIWKPCVLVDDISVFKEDIEVTVDGQSGNIFLGKQEKNSQNFYLPLAHKLNSKIYLQMSIPRMAKSAMELNTDGVGLLRTNLIVEETGNHPYFYYIKQNKEQELIDILANGIMQIAETFNPKPVWIRTMDFSTDELSLYNKGEEEIVESNPLLGWRGIVRGLDQKELLSVDFQAIKKVLDAGYNNIGIIFPMVRDVSEYILVKEALLGHGIKPHVDIKVGSMFETPVAAMQIEDFVKSGLDLAFVGINDITQYTLAADRTNPNMQQVYNPANTAVLNLVYNVLETCKYNNIETTTSFLSPLKKVLPELLSRGLVSFTLQADRINEIAELVFEAEKKVSEKI